MKNGEGLLYYDNNNIVSVHFIPENYLPTDSIQPDWYVASYKVNKDSGYVAHAFQS